MKNDGAEIVGSLLVLAILFGAWMADFGTGQKHVVPATVVATSHVPHSTGVGYTSGGDVAIISHDEKWEVVVSSERFGVISTKAAPHVWAKLKKDDSVTLELVKGGITGMTYKSIVY